MSNVAEFNRAVQKATKDLTQSQLVALHKKIALDALRLVVLKTPVDTGRARGNWQTSIDIFPTNTVDSDAAGALGKGQAVVRQIRPFCILFLTNNVEYITVLEYGEYDPPNPGPSKDPRKGRTGRILVKDGYSTQAPRGMVSVSIAELRQMFP